MYLVANCSDFFIRGLHHLVICILLPFVAELFDIRAQSLVYLDYKSCTVDDTIKKASCNYEGRLMWWFGYECVGFARERI